MMLWSYVPFEKKPLNIKQKNIVHDKYRIRKKKMTVQSVWVKTAYLLKPPSVVNQFI